MMENTRNKDDAARCVLVIEDNTMSCKMLNIFLGLLNIPRDFVETGRAGLEKLNEEHALVLLDIGLPDMDGFMVADTIRKRRDNLANIPIIGMSTHISEADKAQHSNLKISDYMEKPVGLISLTLLLEKHVPHFFVDNIRGKIA